MKPLTKISGFLLLAAAVFFLMFILDEFAEEHPDTGLYEASAPREINDLRDAMQERMAEVLRIREELDRGEHPAAREFARFAGLPHSEFVDDVSEYQEMFEVFDTMYEGIFKAADPEAQFRLVMQTCISCHQQVCPGPLRAMNRLVRN